MKTVAAITGCFLASVTSPVSFPVVPALPGDGCNQTNHPTTRAARARQQTIFRRSTLGCLQMPVSPDDTASSSLEDDESSRESLAQGARCGIVHIEPVDIHTGSL